MVTDGSYICGEHSTTLGFLSTMWYTRETNVTLCINYTLRKRKERGRDEGQKEAEKEEREKEKIKKGREGQIDKERKEGKKEGGKGSRREGRKKRKGTERGKEEKKREKKSKITPRKDTDDRIDRHEILDMRNTYLRLKNKKTTLYRVNTRLATTEEGISELQDRGKNYPKLNIQRKRNQTNIVSVRYVLKSKSLTYM